MIRLPSAPRKLSPETRAKLAERAQAMHQKRNLSAKTSITTTTVKSNTKNENKGRTSF